MEKITKNGHTVEFYELEKGNYNQGDSLIYFADGIEVNVSGEFYVDRKGTLHHTHEFEDGTEIELNIPYTED